MAITAYPKPAQSITSDQFRDFFREIIGTGAKNDAALKPFGDASGLFVKFAAGIGVVDGILVKSTITESRAVDAGSGGGLSRIDTLVANLDFSASPIVQFAVIKGTPAASPVAPSLALSGSVVFRWPIADIAVSPTASTINPADVTDRRTLVDDGVGTWKTSTRPSSPRKGTLGFNETLAKWEWYDGTVWKVLVDAIDAAAITSGTLPIARGGTGATTKATAREALGIFVRSTPLDNTNAVGDVRFW